MQSYLLLFPLSLCFRHTLCCFGQTSSFQGAIWTVLQLFFPQIFVWLSPHEYSNFNWLIFFPDHGSKHVVDQLHPSLSPSMPLIHFIFHRVCFLTSAIQIPRIMFGTLCIVHIGSSQIFMCLLSSLTRMCSS